MSWVREGNRWVWTGRGDPTSQPPSTTQPPQVQPTAAGGPPTFGGGTNVAPSGGFQLPDWLTQGLQGGVSEYNLPSSLQSLLWGNALAGQTNIDWSQMPDWSDQGKFQIWWRRQLSANPQLQQVMTDYFGIESYMRQAGANVPREATRYVPGQGAVPSGRYEYEGQVWPAGMTPQQILQQTPAFLKWQVQMARGITEGGGGGARTSGFLPDKGAYMAELQGTLTEYAAQLGINREAFEANLAQRGIGGAGQATEARYRDVTAPVMRAGAQATRQSFLDYLQAYQRGSIAAEGFRQQDISRLTGTELAVGQMAQTTRAQNLNRLLEGYLGQGQLDLGFQTLGLQSNIASKEFAFRSYENRLQLWMFQQEMEQRERERESNFWSNLFGDLFGAAGYVAGGFAGK